MEEKVSVTREIVQQLMDRARLSEGEVQSRLKSALDPAYWERLNPGFTVGRQTHGEIPETNPLSIESAHELRKSFESKGYFQTDPILPEPVLKPIRDCIERLKAEQWPPVFAFVYDQVWQVSNAPSLIRLRSEFLGPGCKRTSRVWCFYVVPAPGSKGFAPHADGFGRAHRLTFWIALTDATLENGCIYVIPQDLAPDAAKNYYAKSINHQDLMVLLQSCRALPANAGSILGWNFNVMHWSSFCNRPAGPRISLAVEFIAREAEPDPDELPLLDDPGLPTFPQRIFGIAQGILGYQPHESRLIVYRDLALLLKKHGSVNPPPPERQDALGP
jgi:phytanoyl-CoA dioxygenase PhyH